MNFGSNSRTSSDQVTLRCPRFPSKQTVRIGDRTNGALSPSSGQFGTTREAKGAGGEHCLKRALYLQNHMIESLTVTGLEKDLTGVENVETWRFREALEDSSDLTK